MTACSSSVQARRSSSTASASATVSASSSNPLSSGGASGSVVVGSANFPENELLAEVYALALQAKGVKVTTKLNIGAREVYYPQVEKGTITIIPEYNGTLLTVEVDKTSTAKTTAEVDAALAAKLPSTLAGAQPGPGPGQRLDHGDRGDRRQVPPQVDRRPQAVRERAWCSARRPSSRPAPTASPA